MLRLLLRSPWVKRVSHGVPVARLLLVAEMVMLAQHHLGKLDRPNAVVCSRCSSAPEDGRVR